MTIGFLFWLLMILWLVFGLWWTWPGWPPTHTTWSGFGGSLLLWILLFLLGMRAFGFPVHG